MEISPFSSRSSTVELNADPCFPLINLICATIMVFLTWPYLGQSVLYIRELLPWSFSWTLIFVIEFEKKKKPKITHSTPQRPETILYNCSPTQNVTGNENKCYIEETDCWTTTTTAYSTHHSPSPLACKSDLVGEWPEKESEKTRNLFLEINYF